MTSSLLASDGAGTVSTTRVTESDNDQLINCSVINALLGTMISLRSQSLIVVARVLIFVTLPVRSRIVTVSPIRIGFSNRMIRPDTKLAKISCMPKPRPNVSAATSHCSLDHSIPIIEKPTIPPKSNIRYLVMVVIAYPVPGVKSRCCNSASSSSAGKLRTSWVVMISTRMAISTAPRVIGSRLSTPCTVDVTSHREMFSRKPNAE